MKIQPMPTPTQTSLSQHLAQVAAVVPAEVNPRLPKWLGNASSARRQALKNSPIEFADWYGDANRTQQAPAKKALENSWKAQNQVDSALSMLQSPQAFAAPLLQQALKQQYDADCDVSAIYLRLYIPQTTPLLPIETGAKTWTVSLVEAALHNFDADESKPTAYAPESTFITQPSATGQFNTLPQLREKISIAQFIGLCRTLDVGKQYQRYLKNLLGFNDAAIKAQLRQKVINSLKADAQASLYMAQLKKDVSPQAFNALRSFLKNLIGDLNGRPLLCHDLSLMNAPLTGIVLFAADLESNRSAVPMVAYIPGDPQSPLKYYANGQAFMQDLANKLRSADYQAFFSRFVRHEQRGYFFADLNSRLSQVVWHEHVSGDPRPVWRDEPVAKTNLQFYATKITNDLYEHLYENKLDKLLNDARVTAIPTADADRNARWRHWEVVQKIGEAILEIAAFIATPFVPPLGLLMLGYTAYQLLDDVFEGVLDWAEGLKRQAFGHLMSILEQMVQLGMFAVGAPIAENLLRQTLPKALWDFFDRLTPVTTDRKTRLWNPDLAPYAHDIQLVPGSRPGPQGLHAHQQKQILALDGQFFSIKQPSGNASLEHPTRPHAYRPRVLSNGKGAWLTPVDRPLTWNRTTLLRRLGPSAEGISEAGLERASRISETNDDALRKLYMDHQPPPPLLADTLKRIRIDEQLQTFIDQMNSDDPAMYQKADTQTQLWLLSQTGLWPESKTLRFLNAKGETVWEHKGHKNAAVAQIHEAQMNNGDLLTIVLETLNESERKTLLEEPFGPTPTLPARTAKLRKQLARAAQKSRASLFDSRYRGLEITADARLQTIIDAAPGLPTSAAEDVLRCSTGQQLLDIDQGKVPAPVLERARWAAHHVRISRAHEGLYMTTLENSDTHRLALHSLENLPGWSPSVRLEVRDFKQTGKLHDAIGAPEAPIKRTLVRTIEGEYIPEDEKGMVLAETDFYTAVLQALPDTQRDALGIHIGQGPLLRQTLSQRPLTREALGALLAQDPVRKPAYDPRLMRLPGGMEGYPATPPEAGNTPELALLHELYPGLSPQELAQTLDILNSYPSTPLQTLRYLKNELLRLKTDLMAWRSSLLQASLNTDAPLPPSTVAEAELHRWIWTQELLRGWRHETPIDTDHAIGRTLNLGYPIHGELPVLNANFDHISSLTLKGYPTTRGAPGFLTHFPNLRTLHLSDVALNTIPPEVIALSHLDRLTLRNCNLTLQNRADLDPFTGLKSLDLSNNNQLSRSPNLGHMPELQTLNLSGTHISLFPENLLNRPQLVSADLSNNYLSRLPDLIFQLPGNAAKAFNLSGNGFSRATLQRIKAYCQITGEHFGADANPAQRLMVQALYPKYSVDQANNFIFRLPGGLEDSMAHLVRLKADYERLQADLQEWIVSVPAQHPLTRAPLDEQAQAQQQLVRDELKTVLEAAWRRETALDSDQEPPAASHEMEVTLAPLGDLPSLNIDFEHISKLELRAEETTSIPQGFLEHFPNLESLLIYRYALNDIPGAVFNLPKLKSLSLANSHIRLTTTSADALSDLQNLEYLDLSHNPLGVAPDISKMSGLTGLMIEEAGLTQVPNGIFNLPSLDQVSLRNNQISELPSDLLEMDADRAQGFDLSGNPFSPAAIAMLRSYYNRTAVSFDVPEALQPPPINPNQDSVSGGPDTEGDE